MNAIPGSKLDQELTRLLLTESDANCVIGIGIRNHFESNEDLKVLIKELQSIAKDDPVIMTRIIGTRAMELLKLYNN